MKTVRIRDRCWLLLAADWKTCRSFSFRFSDFCWCLSERSIILIFIIGRIVRRAVSPSFPASSDQMEMKKYRLHLYLLQRRCLHIITCMRSHVHAKRHDERCFIWFKQIRFHFVSQSPGFSLSVLNKGWVFACVRVRARPLQCFGNHRLQKTRRRKKTLKFDFYFNLNLSFTVKDQDNNPKMNQAVSPWRPLDQNALSIHTPFMPRQKYCS